MSKSIFYCNNCGYEAAKWLGKCPTCKQWNTFVEEIKSSTKQKKLFSIFYSLCKVIGNSIICFLNSFANPSKN